MENNQELFPELAQKRPTTLSKAVWKICIENMRASGLKLEDYTTEELEDCITILQKKDLTKQEEIFDVLIDVILWSEICFDETAADYEDTSLERELFECWHTESLAIFRKEMAAWAEREMLRNKNFFKPLKPDTCLFNPNFYTDINFKTQKKYSGTAFVGHQINKASFYADIVSAKGCLIGYIPFEARFEEVEELRFELMKPISHPKLSETYQPGTIKTHREWIQLLKINTEDLVSPFFKNANNPNEL